MLVVYLIGIGYMILVLGSPNSLAESNDSADFPSLLSSLRVDPELKFCDEKIPIEIQEIRERFEKELLLSLWDRPQVILWLKRSHRYLPTILKLLQKSNLPDDLKYIAVAESALRPHVGSRKGAIGFWQFTASTARIHGLVVNEYLDQRRNLVASTTAAIRYLKMLYLKLGSWTLASAAFNMGEEGLMAEILEQGTRDFYQLYLPLETQRYIFRILSVKLIFLIQANMASSLLRRIIIRLSPQIRCGWNVFKRFPSGLLP